MMKAKSRMVLAAASVIALASLACSLALFSSPNGGSPASSGPSGAPANTNPDLPTPVSDTIIAAADAEETLLENVYARVSPAVVNIDVSANTTDQSTAEPTDFGSGSGFVIDTDGHIVTNNHVVSEADAIRVTFYDGRVFTAKVIGEDQYADIAVIKIDVPSDYPLTTVELGNSDELQVGQRVIAIGNPFGLTGSMTVGIVSAVGRTLPSEVITSGGGLFSNPMIIQTDAAINPGNSGGPLLDSHGRVIGITAAIRSTTGVNSGIGFAVPVNTVKRAIPQIIQTGHVQYPYLGISSQSVIPMSELAEKFNLPVDSGVLIQEIAADGPAEKAGLKGGTKEETIHGRPILIGGDIITAIDGNPIHNFDELLAYLVSNTSVGQTIKVTIIRDGKTMDVSVTLTARPAQ